MRLEMGSENTALPFSVMTTIALLCLANQSRYRSTNSMAASFSRVNSRARLGVMSTDVVDS